MVLSCAELLCEVVLFWAGVLCAGLFCEVVLFCEEAVDWPPWFAICEVLVDAVELEVVPVFEAVVAMVYNRYIIYPTQNLVKQIEEYLFFAQKKNDRF